MKNSPKTAVMTAVSALLLSHTLVTHAETASTAAQEQVLESIAVKTENKKPYAATKAKAVLRSDASLFETAQSISVITRDQIDQKGASTVADALVGVAGVTAGPYGRRGTDDFIIRGQVSSAQTYMDGLRLQTSDSVLRSEDLAGLESIEVVKGPTSVGFGMALPGGLVNLTTKRPQAETFYRGSATYGSYANRDATFDLNYAPNQSEKGAVRLVGHVSDQHDPTDYVYFKNYYISPSYNFDLGDKDELSVIASYHKQDYIRQQGVPYSSGAYKNYSHSLFFGEPDHGYDVETYRTGFNYTHYFDSAWVYKQNFAVTKTDLVGNAVLATNGATLPTIKRAVNNQDMQTTGFAWDNNVSRHFDFSRVSYDVMLGLDAFRERSDYYRRTDTINSFSATKSIYGITSTKTGTATQAITYSQYLGLYLRNTFKIDDKWTLNLAGRHDWTQVRVKSLTANTDQRNSDNAFTGSASLMYQLNDHFAPYISYATSFLPVTDTDIDGNLLSPEKGKQYEAGMKFQAYDQRLQGYLAYYDLTRNNVTEAVSTGVYEQTGEQKTKGFETEIVASVTPQLNVSATYSFIPFAKTTESLTTSDIGKRINHVPRNSGTLSTQYYFSEDKLGWNIGGGVSYQGARTAQRGTYYVALPAYTLFDVSTGYEAKNWGATLSIKNLFDKEYLVGTSPNAQLVNWGDPRRINFTLRFKY